MKNKVKVISCLVAVVVLFASFYFKAQVIEKHRAEEKVTIASIQNEKGTPVYAAEVKYGKLAKLFKATARIESKNSVTLLIPAKYRTFVSSMSSAKMIIDNQEFSIKKANFSKRTQDYTGFMLATVEVKPAVPFEKRDLKIAYAPYDENQKYNYIPNDAVYRTGDKNFVYLVVDKKVEKRPVEVIFKEHTFAAISYEGIKPGDLIITSDQRDLKVGQVVNVVER